MDISIASLLIELVKALVEERWSSLGNQHMFLQNAYALFWMTESDMGKTLLLKISTICGYLDGRRLNHVERAIFGSN